MRLVAGAAAELGATLPAAAAGALTSLVPCDRASEADDEVELPCERAKIGGGAGVDPIPDPDVAVAAAVKEDEEALDVKAGGSGGASAVVVVAVVVVVVVDDDAVDEVEVTGGGTTATLLAFRGSASTFGFALAPLTSVFEFVEEEVIRARPAGREFPVVVVSVVEPADFEEAAAPAPCAIGLKPVLIVVLPPPPVELAKFCSPSCEPVVVAFGVGSVVVGGRASVRDADRDEEEVVVDPLTVRV